MILGKNNAKAYNGMSLPEYTTTRPQSFSPQHNKQRTGRTVQVRLPIHQTRRNVFPSETLASGTKLIIPLKSSNDDRALRLGQKRRIVRKVDDDPKGENARDDRHEALEDEYPGPGWFATDTVHLGDRSLAASITSGVNDEREKERGNAYREETTECAGYSRGGEKYG